MDQLNYSTVKDLLKYDRTGRVYISTPSISATFPIGEGSLSQQIECTGVVLNRHKVSYHIPDRAYAQLVGSSQVGNPIMSYMVESANVIFDKENNGYYDNGTPRFLFATEIVAHSQAHIRAILFEIIFYSTSERLVDTIGRAVFLRKIEEITGIARLNSSFGITYKEDAEEAAHALLKSMISEEAFIQYKKLDYVEIKGTKGRTYKIKKNEMITVTQDKQGKVERYRLCIEPKYRGTICPTDEVIAKLKLIQANEGHLHKLANKFKDYNHSVLENTATSLNLSIG